MFLEEVVVYLDLQLFLQFLEEVASCVVYLVSLMGMMVDISVVVAMMDASAVFI